MRNFRGHNPDKGMVHPRKPHCSRRNLVISDSDVITDKDYSMEEDASKQLVLYDPQTTHGQQREVQFTEPIYHSTPLQQRFPKRKYGHSRVLPSIDAYTVQCSQCFKWRVVPTKEKYEELRETICDGEPFVCARAREWNRVLSCSDPEDMAQDETMVWAIDKPNIAQTSPGWDREVRIRGEGCSKFADVYYTSPAGTKLRSMVEIERYLAENPFYVRQGVYLGQFSFATPKPLQEDYIRKRKYPATTPLQEDNIRKRKYSATSHELPEILEPFDVNPLRWAAPPTRGELLQMGASFSNIVNLDERAAVNPEAVASSLSLWVWFHFVLSEHRLELEESRKDVVDQIGSDAGSIDFW